MSKMCEKCGKDLASVLYTDIREGKVTHCHLCEACAKKMGMPAPSKGPGVAIASLLAGMLEEAGAERAEAQPSRCATCDLTYAEFRERGRLGCPDCYASFSATLRHLLRRIHGSDEHKGKVPTAEREDVAGKREARRLQQLLKKAIDEEAFEQAAELRDRLRALEAGLSPATGEE